MLPDSMPAFSNVLPAADCICIVTREAVDLRVQAAVVRMLSEILLGSVCSGATKAPGGLKELTEGRRREVLQSKHIFEDARSIMLG